MQHQLSEKRSSVAWWVYEAISDLQTDIFCITGGFGSAKTTGSAIFFLDRWLMNRESQVSWAVAPTHTKIEQILLPAVRFILHEIWGLTEGVHYRIYKGRFFKLVLKNYAHEIHFLSGDRPGLFVGSNVATLWITEPGLMDREVFEKGQTRLRCPKALVRQTILEGTPEGLTGNGAWWAELADIPGIGFDRRDEARNIRRFIVETTHNKHLKPSPEEYAQKKIRDVFGYDKNKVISYEKGLFKSWKKGSAYYEFIESRNVIGNDEVQPSPHLPLKISFDFNLSPLAYVVIQEFTARKNYYSPMTKKHIILHEGSGATQGLMDAVVEISVEFPAGTWGHTPIEIYGDASGHARNLFQDGDNYTAIEQYFRGLGYRNITIKAGRQNPPQQHRLEKTAAMMVYERVAVKAKCRKLIESFIKTALKPGTWDIEKPKDDTWTHWGDAASYYIYDVAKDIDLANPNARRVIGAAL